MNTSVVTVLVLHNQSCSACYVGDPCPVAERIHDEWLRRMAPAPVESLAEQWATEDAA